jgi:hypothetical protein
MLVKLIKISEPSSNLRSNVSEVYINTDHIISINNAPPEKATTLITEAKQLGIMNPTISSVIISEGNRTNSIYVLGNPREIYNKINKSKLLKG